VQAKCEDGEKDKQTCGEEYQARADADKPRFLKGDHLDFGNVRHVREYRVYKTSRAGGGLLNFLSQNADT
jgi:hypothetical protein